MNEVLALLFGAGIIVLFSYDRFNLATYDGEGRLDRLITLLSPDKLRARGTVLTAYAFYVGMLLVTYLILCAYAEILPVLGGQDLRPEVGAAELPSAAATPTRNTSSDGLSNARSALRRSVVKERSPP